MGRIVTIWRRYSQTICFHRIKDIVQVPSYAAVNGFLGLITARVCEYKLNVFCHNTNWRGFSIGTGYCPCASLFLSFWSVSFRREALESVSDRLASMLFVDFCFSGIRRHPLACHELMSILKDILSSHCYFQRNDAILICLALLVATATVGSVYPLLWPKGV